MNLRIENIGDRRICIGGLGKDFYQNGFPISFSVDYLKEKGIEVSPLHIADECLKHGWTPKTTIKKLQEELSWGTTNKPLPDIERFCNADYLDQREMIFEYLFNSDYDTAKSFIKSKIS